MKKSVELERHDAPMLAGYGDDLVRMFYASLSPRTLEAYQYGLADFARFLETNLDNLPHILLAAGNGHANSLVLRWRTDLLARGKAPKTVNLRLNAVRSFVKLARTVGMISWTIDVPGLKAEVYRDTRGPGTAGVEQLLAEIDRRESRIRSKARRDRSLVRLMFDLGLRRGEIVGLDLAHIDLDAPTVAVLGKGKRDRTLLTLSPAARAALVAWLDVRGAEAGPLFVRIDKVGRLGARLSGPGIAAVLTDLGRAAGLERRVRPHGLRHAAITAGLDAGVDIRKMRKFSRHADMKTMLVYDDNREDIAGQIAATVSAMVGNRQLVESHDAPI